MTPKLAQRVDPDLLHTVQALFPGASLSVERGSRENVAFRFVPSVRRCHMLVPADNPASAAAAVDRPSAKDTRSQVVKRRAVSRVLGSRSLAALAMPRTLQITPSTNSILDYLSDLVGEVVHSSVAIGSRRANRKPVLTVYTGDTEIGYAKVGLSPLANELIDHEASVLHTLKQVPAAHYRSPQVIHHGKWGSSSVLLIEGLQPPRQRPTHAIPIAAIAEIVGSSMSTAKPISSTRWFASIVEAGRQLDSMGRPELTRAAGRYEEVFGSLAAPFGRWHGDLGPWNMAWDGSTASIWDWERSEPSVPAGIDVAHFTSHTPLRDVGNMPRARAVLTRTSTDALRRVLRALGHREDDRLVRACLLGYLLSVGARFTTDGERVDGDAVRPLANWYLTVLDDQLNSEGARSWN